MVELMKGASTAPPTPGRRQRGHAPERDLKAVYSSHPDEWEEVSLGGNGPAYRDRFVPSTEPDFNGTQLDVVSHYGYAVFESDDDISSPDASGSMDPDRSLAFDWARFPAPAIGLSG